MNGRILPAVPASVSEAARVVRVGRLVAYPTDTVYGLGCDPFNEAAVELLFEAKGRESKPVAVICASEAEAAALVVIEGEARRLATSFWPGALTIVARTKLRVPERLDQGTGYLGVRVPNDRTARSLAAEAGGWVTGTSANRSGAPPCRTAEEVIESLGDRIDLVIDGGRLVGTESTVVKVVGAAVEVLRRGAIGIEPGATRETHQD